MAREERASLVDALRGIERALLRPVDVAWLAAFRILFGGALAVSMQRFLAYGWVDELLVDPTFRFRYWGFAWVEPLSRGAMHALFWALVGLGLAVAAGLAFRLTAPLFAAGLTYIQLLDVSTYLNHYYFAGLLAWLLAVSPAHRAFSVDAWIRSRRAGHGAPRGRMDHVAAAWLALFRVQIGAVYFFAALAKAQSDWLLHGQPLAIWLGARTDLPLLGPLFTLPGVPLAMSWLGFLYDLTIVGWLSWPRSRPFAYAVVLAFHVTTRLLLDIGMFPIIMSTAALVFFSPSWPRRLVRALRRAKPDARDAGEAELPEPVIKPSLAGRAALALGALYCLVQLLAPFRCHLYGGNVLWHEQGMRFSWRVMVRAKGGATTFLVTQKETGRVFHVSPNEYLTPFQDNEMASQPDLVLQLAHHIQRDLEGRGFGPVEVRVESKVSLNGRRGALMIDPNVDLTTVRDGVAPARWILPAPTEAPPATRPVL